MIDNKKIASELLKLAEQVHAQGEGGGSNLRFIFDDAINEALNEGLSKAEVFKLFQAALETFASDEELGGKPPGEW